MDLKLPQLKKKKKAYNEVENYATKICSYTCVSGSYC